MMARLERGEGRIRLILITGFVALIIVAAFRIVPVYVTSYELKEYMDERAKFNRVDGKTTEEVRVLVLRKAQELLLPVATNKVRVRKVRNGLNITVSYTIPIDLFVYEWVTVWDLEVDSTSSF